MVFKVNISPGLHVQCRLGKVHLKSQLLKFLWNASELDDTGAFLCDILLDSRICTYTTQ